MTPKFNDDDFENGIIAYFQGDDEFLIDCSSDGRDGFKEAWYSTEGKKYDRCGDNASDAAFEQLVDQVDCEFRRRATPPASNLNHLKGTVHEFLINTLSDPPRVLCLAIVAGVVIGNVAYEAMKAGLR